MHKVFFNLDYRLQHPHANDPRVRCLGQIGTAKGNVSKQAMKKRSRAKQTRKGLPCQDAEILLIETLELTSLKDFEELQPPLVPHSSGDCREQTWAYDPLSIVNAGLKCSTAFGLP